MKDLYQAVTDRIVAALDAAHPRGYVRGTPTPTHYPSTLRPTVPTEVSISSPWRSKPLHMATPGAAG